MHMGNPRHRRDLIQRYTRGLDNVSDSLFGGFLVVSRLFLKKATTSAGSLRNLMSTTSDAPWACSLGLWSVVRESQTQTLELKGASEITCPSFIDEKTGACGGGEWICPNSGRSGAHGLSSLESTMVDSYFSISWLVLKHATQLGPGWAGQLVATPAGWIHIPSQGAEEQSVPRSKGLVLGLWEEKLERLRFSVVEPYSKDPSSIGFSFLCRSCCIF